jgi:hypothetical protein
MTDANLVILRAGETKGLWWELQMASRLITPRGSSLLYLLAKGDIIHFVKRLKPVFHTTYQSIVLGRTPLAASRESFILSQIGLHILKQWIKGFQEVLEHYN